MDSLRSNNFTHQSQFTCHEKYHSAFEDSCITSSVALEEICKVCLSQLGLKYNRFLKQSLPYKLESYYFHYQLIFSLFLQNNRFFLPIKCKIKQGTFTLQFDMYKMFVFSDLQSKTQTGQTSWQFIFCWSTNRFHLHYGKCRIQCF